MKMFNKERKFEEMNDQNHPWLYSCPNQFIDKEMQYRMNFCLSSLLEKGMFDGQHQCSGVSIQQLNEKWANEWMNVYNWESLQKCMIHRMSQYNPEYMDKLVNPSMYKLMSKLIKSINIVLNIKN